MQDLIVNARYLSRPMTGVDRVAKELTTALKSHPEFLAQFQIRERAPRHFRNASLAKAHTLFDEQVTLNLMQRSSLLLSPCNTGPALRRNHIVMMHDAQVWSQPDSYAKVFRLRYRLLLPLLGRSAVRIIVPSEFTKAELLRFRVTSANKISVVRNGADHILRVQPDLSVLSRHGLKPNKFFLAIGSLARHKNLEMLVRASEARNVKTAPLVITGGGDPRVFKQSGIKPSPSVKVIGRITDAELRALYDTATALVFPSQTEGFGLPPAEAMFCACPVIATKGGAVPEVCGTAAISLDPNDPSAWTAAMLRMASSPEDQRRMRAAGRQQISKFTWQAAADQFVSALKLCTSNNWAKPRGRAIGIFTGLPDQSDRR